MHESDLAHNFIVMVLMEYYVPLLVLEQGSIDKTMLFITLAWYYSFFILVCSPNTYAYKGVFNPNIYSNISAKLPKGLHFSGFHCLL